SRDAGKTWEVQQTRQPLPLNGVFFLDEQRGWSVGELGLVLATADGGKTWAVQRKGGDRVAVLLLHARPDGVPLDAVALLGGSEGYRPAAVRVAAADGATASPARAADPARLAAAVRQAGGAAAESLWQFPLGSHLAGADRDELLRAWGAAHGDRADDD